MTESNKQTLIHFGKAALLVILAIIVIMVSAAVWNGVSNDAIDPFLGWVAGINFIVEGLGIWSLARKFFHKPVKKDEKKDSEK